MVGFGDVVCWFAWFSKDNCDGFSPFTGVDIELEDCPEDVEEVIDDGVDGFLEDNVGYAIWSWGFVGVKVVGCVPDVILFEVSEEVRGFRYVVCGMEGVTGGGEKKDSAREILLSSFEVVCLMEPSGSTKMRSGILVQPPSAGGLVAYLFAVQRSFSDVLLSQFSQ